MRMPSKFHCRCSELWEFPISGTHAHGKFSVFGIIVTNRGITKERIFLLLLFILLFLYESNLCDISCISQGELRVIKP